MAVINGEGLLIVSSASGTDLFAGLSIIPRSIRWIGATTNGHTVICTDAAGNVVWQSVGAGSNYVEESDLSRKWPAGITGFKVSTLGSGVIHLYYKPLTA